MAIRPLLRSHPAKPPGFDCGLLRPVCWARPIRERARGVAWRGCAVVRGRRGPPCHNLHGGSTRRVLRRRARNGRAVRPAAYAAEPPHGPPGHSMRGLPRGRPPDGTDARIRRSMIAGAWGGGAAGARR